MSLELVFLWEMGRMLEIQVIPKLGEILIHKVNLYKSYKSQQQKKQNQQGEFNF